MSLATALRRLFGYRTTLAASGSLPMADLQSLGFLFSIEYAARHGANVIALGVANTNSMLPTFDANAILLLEQVAFESLSEGDIVTYRAESGALVVHRLNERVTSGWFALGDGNTRLDNQVISKGNFDRRVCGILYGAKNATTNQ